MNRHRFISGLFGLTFVLQLCSWRLAERGHFDPSSQRNFVLRSPSMTTTCRVTVLSFEIEITGATLQPSNGVGCPCDLASRSCSSSSSPSAATVACVAVSVGGYREIVLPRGFTSKSSAKPWAHPRRRSAGKESAQLAETIEFRLQLTD